MSLKQTLLAILLALSGCRLLPEPPPIPMQHDLGPPLEKTVSYPWSRAEVTAPGWMQDSRLCYRLAYSQPTALQSYTLDSWVAPPAELLENRLNRALQPGRGPMLKIEMQRFEQVFEQPKNARVVLAFSATLMEPETNRPVAMERFQLQRPTPTADAAGALEAFPELIQQAEQRLIRWYHTHLPPRE